MEWSPRRWRITFALLVTVTASYLAGCVAATGPGYEIDRQDLDVQFTSAPEPVIHLSAQYQLRNIGNRPLSFIEVRLPGRNRFHFSEPRAEWDHETLSIEESKYNPRNNLSPLPKAWSVNETHTLRLSVDYLASTSSEGKMVFSRDAFFLPAEGWCPELLPSRGLFGIGGVPPNKWVLRVRTPADFLVHSSGRKLKRSQSGNEQTISSEQFPTGGYPFVLAGRYHVSRLTTDMKVPIYLWTRAPQATDALREPGIALSHAIQAYNTVFGERPKESPLFIAECPMVDGCFSGRSSGYVQLIYGDLNRPFAEMISLDAMVVNFTNGAPSLAVAAGPSLASSWLGYGQNPGFFEQVPPLSALPAFAASLGREAIEGPAVRGETIRHVLTAIPVSGDKKGQAENQTVIRAKSLLFFYGLQDQYSSEVLDRALNHMLSARRGRGFNLDDLIAAIEQENHQNVAQFVRGWMKHPGVPNEFRARYERAAEAAPTTKTKETAP
jgi:hypothetical protein